MASLVVLIFLYGSLSVSIGVIVEKIKSNSFPFHWSLGVLIFSETFLFGATGIEYDYMVPLIFYWGLFTYLISLMFSDEYIGKLPKLRTKPDYYYEQPYTEAGFSPKIALEILITLLLIGELIFHYLAIILSVKNIQLFLLIGSYLLFHGLLIVLSRKGILLGEKTRELFYLLKIPYPIVVPFGLIERFGLQSWLIPFLFFHYTITVLWLWRDLPEMMRPPRIT